ncbi:hypothetical protein RI103_32685 [Paraburkholderia sp. FT54]|uniref:hypothetical protein n=1 Tax=Paraburkholderia sp. FT54 TaxID=3074437 RepID=UPI0028772882|nr:hypothetical protein [Paraburkholderia sp. FT54]WNC92968.1 hypothetical protein RI103_32685 [Paraburkholderia sp. FT54]
MERNLEPHERRLLGFILDVNKPLYPDQSSRWLAQLEHCTVHEVNVPYCLRISHVGIALKPEGRSRTLRYELVGLDEGIPVLIYVVTEEAEDGFVLDIFSVDRLDGEPVVNYPEAGDGLMIVDGNSRVGGADLRHIYGGGNS